MRHLAHLFELFIICNIVNQFFGGFPAQTGVCDGFSIDTAANLLAAFFDVAFYHDTLYKMVNIGVQLSAVHDFLDNTNLLFKLFAGVGMVGIDNAGRIFQIHFAVHFQQQIQVRRSGSLEYCCHVY